MPPPPNQDRELLQRFEVQKFLGKGSYGSVFRVRRLSDSKVYALKETNVKHMSSQDKADAVNEIRLLASIRHHHVVNYHEAFVDGNRLCIVMEYAPHGDLSRAIRKRASQQKYYSEDQIWSYLVQIAHGLQALHKARILHRDVKTANVLRCAGETVKLSDLGVAKLMKGAMTKTQIGTPHYMPPEVWKSRPYSFSSDTWALGCVVYELATFSVPFEARSLEELRYRVLRGKYNPLPSFYSQELHQVVRTMLEPEPSNRPSMDQLLNLPSVRSRLGLYQKPPTPPEPPGYPPSVMLETIIVPKNLRMLGKRLPEARYPDGLTPKKEPAEKLWPGQQPHAGVGGLLPKIGAPSVQSTHSVAPSYHRHLGHQDRAPNPYAAPQHRNMYAPQARQGAAPSRLPALGPMRGPTDYEREAVQRAREMYQAKVAAKIAASPYGQAQRADIRGAGPQWGPGHPHRRDQAYAPSKPHGLYNKPPASRAPSYAQSNANYNPYAHAANPYAPSRAPSHAPSSHAHGRYAPSVISHDRYREDNRSRIPSSRIHQNLPVPPHRRGMDHLYR